MLTTNVELAMALTDPKIQAAVLRAIRPVLARLLDVPEQAISIDGASAEMAALANPPGTT